VDCGRGEAEVGHSKTGDSMNGLEKVEHQAIVAAQPSNATTLLQAIERAASNPDVDMDKMERLFAMHQKLVQMDAQTAFNAAMARAQARMVPVANNATNEQTSSRYAKLAAINKAITPIYTEEGFSISFDSAESPIPGFQRTVAIVSHSGGHDRQYHLDLPLDDVGAKGNVNKTKVHATGSTNSYSRRYLVCMIFNVTTEDDKDGNKEGGGMSESQLADFKAAIDALTDMDASKELWRKIAKVCTETKDREGYAELKDLMTAKRETFGKAAA
jgi:hypothetical protein